MWVIHRGARSLGMTIAVLLTAPLVACDTEPTDPAIADFKNCVDNVASSLTEEQRVRVEGAVDSAIRAVGGKGAVEFSNKLVRETSDTVNIEIIGHCFTLAQGFPNTPPEVKIVYANAATEMDKKQQVAPSATLDPGGGELPTTVTVRGENWPPNTDLTVRTSGGHTVHAVTNQAGSVTVNNVPLSEQARVSDQDYATVTLEANNDKTLFALADYRVAADPSTSEPSPTESTETTETDETSETTEPTDTPPEDTSTALPTEG
jgi:hypothetical protein